MSQEIKTRRLYVGNFPYEADETALRELFSDYGEVQTVEVMRGAGESQFGKHQGFAFVGFATELQAGEAFKALHTKLWRGRKLILGPAYPKGKTRSDYVVR